MILILQAKQGLLEMQITSSKSDHSYDSSKKKKVHKDATDSCVSVVLK